MTRKTKDELNRVSASRLPFPQRMRLAWLERNAKRKGFIDKLAIAARFDCSTSTIQFDLRTYRRLNGDSLDYDISTRRHLWRKDGTFLFPTPPWKELDA